MTQSEAPADRDANGAAGDAWAHNARVGLVLFFVYLALYGGFIGLAAFGKEVMARPLVGGVNVAVSYGLLLIAAAFLLALLYMALCRREPVNPSQPEMTEAQIAEKAQSEEGSA